MLRCIIVSAAQLIDWLAIRHDNNANNVKQANRCAAMINNKYDNLYSAETRPYCHKVVSQATK